MRETWATSSDLNPHNIENGGKTDLVFLEVFPTPDGQDISLAERLARTPSRRVDQHIGREYLLRNLAKQKMVVTRLRKS